MPGESYSPIFPYWPLGRLRANKFLKHFSICRGNLPVPEWIIKKSNRYERKGECMWEKERVRERGERGAYLWRSFCRRPWKVFMFCMRHDALAPPTRITHGIQAYIVDLLNIYRYMYIVCTHKYKHALAISVHISRQMCRVEICATTGHQHQEATRFLYRFEHVYI